MTDRRERSAGRDNPPGAVGGRRAVAEAIRAGAAREILILTTSKATQGMRAVLDAARDAGIPVIASDRALLDAAAHDHQGVVARLHGRAERPAAGRLSERELASATFEDNALVVVLDGVADPQNLGAAARSAESAGASMLVTRTRRAADVTPAAIRASAGALMHLPHARVANIARALERLQDAGFWVVGLDGSAPTTIYDEPCPPGRVAIVVGSEGEGMARLVRERCDALVSLPMLGNVGSLNVSASLAAVLYAFVLPSRSLFGV